MSSQAIFRKMELLEEGLKNLGWGKPARVALSTDARGYAAAVIDLSKSAPGSWASLDKKVIIVAVPAGASEPLALRTQSHAYGQFIDGSCSFELHMEVADLSALAQADKDFFKFSSDVMHILRGQNGAPVQVMLTAGEPVVNGIEGAVATSGSEACFVLPYGRAVMGGV